MSLYLEKLTGYPELYGTIVVVDITDSFSVYAYQPGTDVEKILKEVRHDCYGDPSEVFAVFFGIHDTHFEMGIDVETGDRVSGKDIFSGMVTMKLLRNAATIIDQIKEDYGEEFTQEVQQMILNAMKDPNEGGCRYVQ